VLVANQSHSKTTDTAFDLGTASATGLLTYPDLNPLSSDNSPEWPVGLTLDSTVSSTQSRPLSLTLEILEPELQVTVHRDPGAEELGTGPHV